jgi:hypothetical protein
MHCNHHVDTGFKSGGVGHMMQFLMQSIIELLRHGVYV